jgi:hypothetical protein
MVRRALVIALFLLFVLACAAAPALAYGPLAGFTVSPGAQLVPGAGSAVVVWAGSGGATLLAQRFADDGSPQPAHVVAAGISGLSGWRAAGAGTEVTVVWKAGETIFAKCIDASDGRTVYGPVTVLTDAAVAALASDARSATVAGVAPDGADGAYVWCRVSPTTGVSGYGDTLLNHLSATGALAVAAPQSTLARGTIAGLDVYGDGHAFALLGPPGRSGLGVQRFSPALSADPGWSRPVSPYSPLLPVPSATPAPIGIAAGSGALIAWREGARVKVQRYPRAGGITWLRPASVSMAGDVELASDFAGGAYLVGPAGGGILARHILGSGAEAGPGSVLPVPGLGSSPVLALTANRAGDLFAGYGDAATPAVSGIGLLTCLGAWSAVGPATLQPATYSGAVPDGAGGAYLLGDGAASGYLWRVADTSGAAAVTFRPRSELVAYGKSVVVSGYVTGADSLPAGGAAVTITGGGRVSPAASTQPDGFYQTSIAPRANAAWTASASGATSGSVLIRVSPRLTLALSHTASGTRLTEIFTGAVTPRHAGSRVLIQKAVGSHWRTVASARLDGRSRYRATWSLPHRTATYKLRAMLPAHTDHAEGATVTATLKVVIKKG